MFNLSKSLVAHAVKHLGLPAEMAKDVDGNKDEIVKHIGDSITEGKISFNEVLTLSDGGDVKSKGEKALEAAVENALGPVAKAMADIAASLQPKPQTEQPAPASVGAKAYAAATPEPVAADEVDARVKTMKDRFDTTKQFISAGGITQTKSVALPALSGEGSKEFAGMSELDRAVTGATLKYLYHRAAQAGQGRIPAGMKMTDLDWDLIKYAAHEMEWAGPVGMRGEDDDVADFGWAKGGRLNGVQTKAVLDDATSGGLEAVPAVFDDMAILTPLLTSELLPLVDMRVTTRRRVEGFTLANPDMYWTAEGTAPTAFNTASFIGEFNTNIHPCVGWMEIGMDFQADSPVAIADLIASVYANKAKLMLENAITNGTGTGEPLGAANTVGATTVASANSTVGPPVVADYESLLFAIPKEFMQEAGPRMAFLANQVSYQRARGLAVGASDARRVFGMDERSWKLLGSDYKINHGLGNSTILNACWNRYVLYRRAGFSVRVVREDADLAKKNLEMMVVRMRYGGQMNHASAVAVMTDAQA